MTLLLKCSVNDISLRVPSYLNNMTYPYKMFCLSHSSTRMLSVTGVTYCPTFLARFGTEQACTDYPNVEKNVKTTANLWIQ